MNKKILIVDDEPEMISAVKRRLEINNYDVISASEGEEGISKARSENPDLILMDIMMPEMTGGDAAKILKKDEETRNIPIIFFTAIVSKNEEQKHQKIQIDGKSYEAIAKPFDSLELLKKVAEYCKH